MTVFRNTRGEDLFELRQVIDGVTSEMPHLIFDSPTWSSFVHTVNGEIGYRRNKADLAARSGYNDHRLGVAEAAELLGVAQNTVRHWADDGVLPHIRTPGDQRRFSRAELEEFTAKLRAG